MPWQEIAALDTDVTANAAYDLAMSVRLVHDKRVIHPHEHGVAARTMKQKIQLVLDHLPENTTIEKVIEELCVLEVVEAGLADVEAGRLIRHEQVVAELKKRYN